MMILPSPQQLRYLVTLAELGHFGRAAAACSVTQSTLSAGLIALERQLAASLLERGASKRPVFTPLGLQVVERARAALAALEAVSETAQAARAPLSGPLRMGVIPTIGPFLLPRMMPAIAAAFPLLQLWLREDQTDKLLAGLEAGRLDVLLLALPCDCGNAETLPIATDAFWAALPTGHRLAAQPVIAAASMAAEPLLLLEDGHCLRAQTQEACGLPQGVLRGDTFAATSLHTLVQMVAGGLGSTLLPRLAIDGGVLAGTDLVVRPMSAEGGQQPSRMLALAWRPKSPRAAELRGLAPAIAQALRPV